MTALKTVSARIRGSKTDLSELGESTEDLANGFSKYADEIKALTGFDIMVDGTTDQFKDLYDIFEGIAGVWDQLSDTQQARVSEILGGTRQLQVISSIIGNWGDAAGAYATAMGKAGAATRANDIYMETAAAHLNQLKSTFTEFANSLLNGGNGGIITPFIDAGKSLIEILGSLAPALSGIGSILGGIMSVAGGFLGVVANVASLADGLIPKIILITTLVTRLMAAIKTFGVAGVLGGLFSTQALGAIAKATELIQALVAGFSAAGFKGAIAVLSDALGGIGASATAAVGGVIGGAALSLAAINKVEQNRLQNIIDQANETKEVFDGIAKQYDNYNATKDAYVAGTGSVNEMVAARHALIDSLNEERAALGGLGGAYLQYNADVDSAVAAARRYTQAQLEAAAAAEKAKLNGISQSYKLAFKGGGMAEGTSDWISSYRARLKEYDEVVEEYGAGSSQAQKLAGYIAVYQDVLGDAISAADAANSNLVEAFGNENIKHAVTNVKDAQELRQSLIDAIAGSGEFDIAGTQTIDDLVDSFLLSDSKTSEVFSKLQGEKALAEEMANARKSIVESMSAQHGIPEDGMDSLFKRVNFLTQGLDLSSLQQVFSLVDSGAMSIEDAVNHVSSSLGQAEIQAQRAKDTLAQLWSNKDFKDTRAELVQLYQTGGITGQQIQKLAADNDDLAQAMAEAGVSADYLAGILNNEIANGNGFDRITAGAIELDEALNSVAHRYDELDAARARYVANASVETNSQAYKDMASAYEEAIKQIESGKTNSNEFWNASEFILGMEELEQLDFDPSQIAERLQSLGWAFTDAEDSGKSFMLALLDIYNAGDETAQQLQALMDIGIDENGFLNFDIPDENIDKIADVLGVAPELISAVMRSLGDFGSVMQTDAEGALQALMDCQMAAQVTTDEVSTSVVNLDKLYSTLLNDMGKTPAEAMNIVKALSSLDGVSFISLNSDIDSLVQKLGALDLAVQNASSGKIEINADGLYEMLASIGYAQSEIDALFHKLDEDHSISLQADVSYDTVQHEVSDLDSWLDGKHVTVPLETEVEGETESPVPPVPQSVIDSYANLKTSADNATQANETLKSSINGLKSKTVVINYVTRHTTVKGELASGTQHAQEGDYLTGEEGAELVWSGKSAYLTGVGGPTITRLHSGDVVFPADETKKILSGTRTSNLFGSAAGGFSGSLNFGNVLSGYSGTTQKSASVTTNVTVSTNIKEITEDLEEQLDKLKEEIDEILERYDFKIFMAEKHEEDASTIISIYRKMQEEVHAQANKYRAMGVEEESEYIRDLQKKWWEYEESIRDARKDEFDDYLNDSNFAIDVMQHNGADSNQIIDSYSNIIQSIEQELEYYSSLGYDYTSEVIQDLMQQLWDAQDQVHEFEQELFDNWVEDQEFRAEEMIRTGSGSADELFEIYTGIAKKAKDRIDKLREQGFDDESDEIQEAKKKVWEYADEAAEAYAKAAQEANQALSDVKGAFETLAKAQQEYNDTGYISIDTFQSLLNNGVQYLGMLMDENGQLVINAESVTALMQAKVEEAAVTQTLNYMGQVAQAIMNGDAATAQALAGAMDTAAASTWAAVDAMMAWLQAAAEAQNMDIDFSGLKENVKKVKSITKTVSAGIPSYVGSTISGGGGGGGGGSSNDSDDRLKALQDVIKWTEDLIKFEHDQMVEALDEQLDQYKEIIDAKKKSLDLTKSELSYNKKITKQTTDIAKLQARIDALALDNSREAAIERAKLVEELSELQSDLEEDQWDHARDLQSDALDAQEDAYSDMIKKRQEEIKNEISSEQKLYDLAIDRIDNHWGELYSDLLKWNYEYGNSLTSDITSAWGEAESALKQYGNTLSAVAALSAAKNSSGGGYGGGGYGYSLGSSSSEEEKQPSVHQIAKDILNSFVESGMLNSGPKELSESEKKQVRVKVSQMEENSANWASANASRRKYLSEQNESLASEIAAITGRDVHKDGNGVWWIDDEQLYSAVFHKGGIVGAQNDEQFALLQKGEWVIPRDMIAELESLLSFATTLRNKGSALVGAGAQFTTPLLKALAGGVDMRGFRGTEGPVIQVDASLSVSGVNDEEILRTIKDHPRTVAEVVARQFK